MKTAFFFFVGIFTPFVLDAQNLPETVIIELNCGSSGSGLEGTYIQKNNAEYSNCPCYEQELGNSGFILIHTFSSGTYKWVLQGTSDGTCNGVFTGFPIPISTFVSNFNCDIRNAAPNNSCITILIPKPIPTITQWGVILLCLSFFTLASLAIYQKQPGTIIPDIND